MSRRYLLEQVDEVSVVQLYADGFSKLSLREKLLAWHLYLAAIAGRDIYYDQRYAHSLELRDVLEGILTHGTGVPAPVVEEVRRFTKLFWINSGPHNAVTARKQLLRLTPDEWTAAVEVAAAGGAPFRGRDGESPHALATRLLPVVFDPDVDPILTMKTPGSGRDILESSANNLYADVSMRDLEGFRERHALNSRLVKTAGRLVEEVYRVDGLYDREIRRIIGHIEDALPYAPQATAAALRALIRFYTTGDDADRVAYDIAWVRDDSGTVDTVNGFVEVYLDPRGAKGAWEGIVSCVNTEKTRRIETIAANAAWFEAQMPWESRFKRTEVTGVSARAIDVVIETGDSGPITPVGINLPNDQAVREQHGSKSVLLANVSEAYERSTPEGLRTEFCWDDAETARSRAWGVLSRDITTELHEVVGHGSGRMAEGVSATPGELLREHYSALEEARSDLVALYFLPHPKLVELGLVPAAEQPEIVRAEYEQFTRGVLLQLRRVREGDQLEEDHMRNRQLVVNWLRRHTGAIEVRRRDGKTYFTVADVDAFHAGVGRLLAEVQRIKGEGDYTAARELIEAYGVHFEPALRDEVVARVDALRLPSYSAFVMPRLSPVFGQDGSIVDVDVSYPCDLETQMLEVLGHDPRMRLSRRLPGGDPVNALTRALGATRAAGRSVADLTESNPTRVGLPYPPSLLAPLADPRGLHYDPQPLGLACARESVAADAARRGAVVDPANVVITASTSESYSWLFKLLCDPGDTILVPAPSYPLFEFLARAEAVSLIPYRLEFHGRWQVDAASVAAAPASTRAVVVVSPNNPTGSYLRAADAQALWSLCEQRGWALVADEVFADYRLEETEPFTDLAASAPSPPVPTFSLGGASKSLGLPQIKLGWMVVGGPHGARREALDGLELIADTFLSVGTPVQLAAPALLRDGALVREHIRGRVAANLAHARQVAAAYPSCSLLPVEGGWTAVVRVPALRTEETLALELLQREAILVHPGYFFDFPHEAYLVVSLLPPEAVFRDAFERTLRLACSTP